MFSDSSPIRLLLLVVAFASLSRGFVPPSAPVSNTALSFGIPSFGAKEDEKKDNKGKEDGEEKKIGLSGLAQLITAGMGSPFLGDFEGVDEETGKMMFSLEANNLVDEKGQSKQTSMPYFESGWVDPEDMEKEGEGFKWPWDK
mmetsp:Transcript_6095/g.9348  ORF Transcript_6095/g.9348 Transcript_6095/m.9348 type:complete len:143 (+) Transcript_6095:143-571(+)|eukprot:CAMPEP_0178912874 /NCGR_PEP_ID=MMETSP0786-20121207/10517_1 /TAXON_ID=186022 /ORGANISM="Thalassionema frauenfeldii, Strain CCMP 1798" /LENGTH=142 /DNA_ID=CAMNT_0020585529 /DNA_START=130 /DNA_END=558 /DNA_ORIENTATION=-